MNKKGMLVILSAPSGCGKDTVFGEIKKHRDDVCESVSATTRSPREGEIDGVNYFFKTVEEFENMIANNELLEYVKYNNCYYGTPVMGVQRAIDEGKVCFLIIEVKGAQKVIEMMPNAVSIFLLPPSLETLKQRLINRQTNDLEDIENRIRIADEELKTAPLYKYQVVNSVLENTVDEINNIINKELDALK